MYAYVCGAIYLGFVLILGSLYTLCVITVKWLLLLLAKWSQSIWRWLEGLQVKDESSTSWYKQVYFVGFLRLHILALSPQVTVYSACIFAEHIQLWNQNSLSYGVWSQGGVDYIVSPFPEHNY